jgi:cytochrome b
MTQAGRVRLWDAPTRLVHWSLVVLVAFSWWTAEEGMLNWHRYSGYGLLGLVLFRLYWGFVGSTSARFAHFVKGPRAIFSYLRSDSIAEPGHNPLGALSVLLLLALLLAQIVLGLFAVDVDGIESGPLSHLVSFDGGRLAAEIHEWVFNALMVFITLHVAAILYYLLLKRDNLIGPMFTGSKVWSSATNLKFASLWLALPGAAIAAAIVWYIVK